MVAVAVAGTAACSEQPSSCLRWLAEMYAAGAGAAASDLSDCEPLETKRRCPAATERERCGNGDDGSAKGV